MTARPRTVLVVAPHPDDEAIGAWALMRGLTRDGARIRILIVSDGAGSHPGSVRWPAARLIRARRRETRRAMASLAIPPARIRFLGLPDGALARDPVALRRAIGRALRRQPPPRLIVGPVPADDHADHRAVAQALAEQPRRGERRLGYQVWPAGANRAARGHIVRLDGVARGMKRRVVRGYRTQTGIITDATAGFAMTHRHLRAFAGPVERFAALA